MLSPIGSYQKNRNCCGNYRIIHLFRRVGVENALSIAESHDEGSARQIQKKILP